MSRPPPTTFRTLKVHTTGIPQRAKASASPAPSPAPSPQARFAELLLQRRPTSLRSKAPAPSGKAGGDPRVTAPTSPLERPGTDKHQEELDDAQAPAAVTAPSESTPLEPGGPHAREVDNAPTPVSPPASVQGCPPGPAIARYLAHTVAGFCNDPAMQGTEGWQVSMPLRDDLLAATTLHLHLSPHWLLLRFDTHDEGARHLILQHQDSLQHLLDEALAPRRDIAITFD